MSSDSLIPLLLAYGEDLPGDIAAYPDDGAAVAEQAVLRCMRTALEGIAAPAPPAEAVAAVLAAARSASAGSELAPLRATLAGEDDGSVEGALLRTTVSALQRAGKSSPPPDVVAGVLAAAGEAARASDLAALRAALGGEAVTGALETESVLLHTTMEALDSLPRSVPPPDLVASLIEAAGVAARTSGLASVRAAVGLAGAASARTEEAVLRTTWEAVERLPRPAPPVSAVHAVLSAASAAVPAPLREAAVLRRAADRPAARYTLSYRRFAYLTAALAFVGFVGIGLWASVDGRRDTNESLASLDEQPARITDGAPESIAEADRRDTPAMADGAAPAPSGGLLAAELDQTVANGPEPRVTDAFRPAEQASFARPLAPPPPPAPADVQEREGVSRNERVAAPLTAPATAGVGLAAVGERAASPGAGLAGTPAVTPAWEAGSDVRLLSLRLQALQEGASGLAWDEPPAPLGAAESGEAAPAGFNAVGTSTAPARFQVRVVPPGSD